MQTIRPKDTWAMISRACTCCLAVLERYMAPTTGRSKLRLPSGRAINYDERAGDIFSRIYCKSNCEISVWGANLLAAQKDKSPSTTLLKEPYYQHDQWRLSLPPIISFEDNSDVQMATSPAHSVATGMLHSRWNIANFIFGRPFL